ncbi:uncharacterized protein LOC124918053 [Impatiens glandulifera]|nr:uncharacterized protein LOC124918053 [Impatiens glandulifera]
MLGRLNTPTALGLVQFGHELNMNNPNHVQIGDLVNPSSSTFSDKNSMVRLPIGQPLDIQKGILGISNSGTPSNDFHDFSGCYENFQGQTEPIGYSFNMVNELGDTMSSMAMTNGPSLNGSVMQGWDGNGIINTSRHSNDSGMIQGMTMMAPFNQRIESTTTTNGLAFYSSNNNNNEFGTNSSFFNYSLSGKQRFLVDKQRKTHNGISYVNNNVGSLEDLIGPVMNQEKGL